MDGLRAACLLLGGLALSGCTPHVGDKCVLNTDCSLTGDRQCDTSEPNGYCTVFGCNADLCPDKAACVMFHASVPGCPYDDYQSPSRTGHTFCLAQCQSDSDCRQSDGYVCRDPRQPPWGAQIIDDVQTQLVCILGPDWTDGGPIASFVDAGVCQPSGPPVPPIEAGMEMADSGLDAGDAALDGGGDALEGGADAAQDASGDGAADSSAADAPGGG